MIRTISGVTKMTHVSLGVTKDSSVSLLSFLQPKAGLRAATGVVAPAVSKVENMELLVCQGMVSRIVAVVALSLSLGAVGTSTPSGHLRAVSGTSLHDDRCGRENGNDLLCSTAG